MVNSAIVFTAPGRVELQEAPPPVPAPGEVLIRTRRSLISTGTELTLLAGGGRPGSVWAELASFPLPVGYSNAGEVVGLGEGVAGTWLGRRVETHCRHASLVTCAVDRLRPIPEGVSDEEATFSSLAEVAMNGLRRVALAWGESVGVFGLGLLGQLVVRLAAAAGAGPVFGIERAAARRRLMPPGPLLHVLDPEAEDLAEAVRRHHQGRALDVVVETTGDPEAIPRQLPLLRDQGRFLVLSSPRGATLFDFHDLCNRRSLTIVGAHGFSHPPAETPNTPWTGRRHGELFLRWLAAGRLDVGGLISHRFAARRAPDAYALLAARREAAMGVILAWDESS
jgi:2-desacetyl-2-hydroxyethyl bacteriochlorophyllide A dehydrogenase